MQLLQIVQVLEHFVINKCLFALPFGFNQERLFFFFKNQTLNSYG